MIKMNDNENAKENELNNKKKKNIKLIVIFLVVFVLIFVGVYFGGSYLQKRNETPSQSGTVNTTASQSVESKVENPIDFKSLKKKNSEIYAYIKIDGTKVDYPIVQSKTDDAFYLRHKAEDKSWSASGAVYTEAANSKDFNDFVTVIYGHNGYSDTFFTTLHYFEKEDFFNSHPYFYIYNALLSRCTVFEFKSLTAADVEQGLRNALKKLSESEGTPIRMEDDACAYLAESAGGDLRKALGCLDFAVTAAAPEPEGKHITLDMIQQVTRRTAMRYDRDGDDHYDIVSAYQKSMRGSDPDAALHYLARLLEAGDLPSACRRLMVCACEDVGLAYPQIIPIVKAAVDIANAVGLPEARLPLADAVVLVATSPKSNSAHDAINAAIADVQAGRTGPIPRQLQNKHYDGEDALVKGQNYKYAHDYENHWVEQQYLPDAIKDVKYYTFGDNKTEQAARAYWARIKGEKNI